MNYYTQGVLAHVCPLCKSYQLEAPQNWPKEEVQEILGAHVSKCSGAFVPVTFMEDRARKAGFKR